VLPVPCRLRVVKVVDEDGDRFHRASGNRRDDDRVRVLVAVVGHRVDERRAVMQRFKETLAAGRTERLLRVQTQGRFCEPCGGECCRGGQRRTGKRDVIRHAMPRKHVEAASGKRRELHRTSS
jgi:hypothetical protein